MILSYLCDQVRQDDQADAQDDDEAAQSQSGVDQGAQLTQGIDGDLRRVGIINNVTPTKPRDCLIDLCAGRPFERQAA